jgi:hypothetical protein
MPQHYAIILTLIAGDTALQASTHRTTLLGFVLGADPETDAQLETSFSRYILNPVLLPLNTPETTCTVFVGVATEANGAGLRNIFRQDSALWREVRFDGRTYDRAEMERRLQQLAQEAGCTHHWTITVDSDLSGDLWPHFVPFSR